MTIGRHISVITLTVNRPMVQPKDTDWLNAYKHKTRIYAVYKRLTHLRPRDAYRLKVRGWKKVLRANGIKRKLQ